MTAWGPTVADELRRDVPALGFKIGKRLRPLTDIERDLVAAAIVEHIRLCNWKVERGPPWGGFGEFLKPTTNARMVRSSESERGYSLVRLSR